MVEKLPAKQTALLVIDVQNGVMDGAYQSDKVIANIGAAIAKARAARVPVIWVQHANEELVSGTPAWQIVADLLPQAGETLIPKQHNSGFEGTDLQSVLAGLGVTTLAIAGAESNWCIRATAYGALERGYNICLIGDAHTTHAIDFPDGRVIEAKDIIDELNIGLRWVSYPNRTNIVVKAQELSFA